MTVQNNQSSAERALRRALSAFPADGLAALRAAGRVTFETQGLPTRRVEDWKYSDLTRALDGDSEGVQATPALSFAPDNVTAIEIVDGVCKIPQGYPYLVSLRDALVSAPALTERLGKTAEQKDHAILGLNTALMEDGVLIRVPKGAKLERPLHLRFRSTGKDKAEEGRHLRVLIVLDESAEADILETHEGPGAFGLATIVTEVEIAANARLRHTRMEALGGQARQAAVLAIKLERDASFEGFYLSQGAAFSRHEILARAVGEGARLALNGAYLVGEARHNDNTTIVEHAVPHTTSQQMFRGVLAGEARGVFQGRVVVKPGAQQTDAQQQSRAILLSRRAEIDAKPELEIYADDVKCSHGATAGELDAAALFFLRSRGIPEKDARGLLVEAFLEQGLDAISNEAFRSLAHGFVRNWLDAHASEVTHADA